LATHVSEPPRPLSPKSVSNPLIMGIQHDPLSSYSSPSLHSQPPVSLPSSTLNQQYPSTGNFVQATAGSGTRIFEVENVAEDKPDSPDISDLSANGSTENLGREPQRSDSQESNSNLVKRFVAQSVPSLESKSDSYIGKDLIAGDLHVTPARQSSGPQQTSQPISDDGKSSRHNSMPYVLPSSMTKPSTHAGNRSASIPEHYSTTSVLDTSPSWQRRGITEETYINPSQRYYSNSHTIHSSGYHSYPASEADIPLDPSESHSSDTHQFNMDELPQAALLSEAFMRFMHSMSLVVRDPTFQPLMHTLDRRFGLQQEPVTTRPSRQDHMSVSRSTTEPVSTTTSAGQEVELRSAIEE